MTLSVERCLDAIRTHTLGLAAAADGNLERRIEHCPEWSMADLVWHLTGVHRFWAHIARELPTDAPELSELARPADDALIQGMVSGMEAMVATLASADQSAPCWTWGQEQTVWFITRHQVQEAAVHHWDATNAARASSWQMDPVLAMDAVDEFLTHSVANPRWPVADAPPLHGTVWFCACVGDTPESDSWRVTDGPVPGTLAHHTYRMGDGDDPQDIDGPAVGGHGSGADFLLWLYRRIPDPCVDGSWAGDEEVLERFRAFTFTD